VSSCDCFVVKFYNFSSFSFHKILFISIYLKENVVFTLLLECGHGEKVFR